MHWTPAIGTWSVSLSSNVGQSYIHTGMTTPEELTARRERKAIQVIDGKAAMAEYLAEPDRRATLTVKLREARLRREAFTALLPPMKKARKRKLSNASGIEAR